MNTTGKTKEILATGLAIATLPASFYAYNHRDEIGSLVTQTLDKSTYTKNVGEWLKAQYSDMDSTTAGIYLGLSLGGYLLFRKVLHIGDSPEVQLTNEDASAKRRIAEIKNSYTSAKQATGSVAEHRFNTARSELEEMVSVQGTNFKVQMTLTNAMELSLAEKEYPITIRAGEKLIQSYTSDSRVNSDRRLLAEKTAPVKYQMAQAYFAVRKKPEARQLLGPLTEEGTVLNIVNNPSTVPADADKPELNELWKSANALFTKC